MNRRVLGLIAALGLTIIGTMLLVAYVRGQRSAPSPAKNWSLSPYSPDGFRRVQELRS